MSDTEWRSRLRWVVVHPHRPEVLLLGGSALPEAELPGEVWTADAEVTATALRELVGVDAILLRSLEEHEDPTTRVQRATLVAAPRYATPLPPGARWVGRAGLDVAALNGNEHAAVAARALDELAAARTGAGAARWADPRGSTPRRVGCAPGWSGSATRRPGRCGNSGSGSFPASCGRRRPAATSTSRPSPTSRRSPTRAS